MLVTRDVGAALAQTLEDAYTVHHRHDTGARSEFIAERETIIDVLVALGPEGYLINVARGTVVDTAVLDQALRAGTIAGAAIDVAKGDAEIPVALVGIPNLQMTPHVAGQSPPAVARKFGMIRDNIENHLTGTEVLSPVKGMKDYGD